MELSAEQLAAYSGASLKDARKFLIFIKRACEKYSINTQARLLCFLSQAGHESASLFYTEELASGKAYEGRLDLGNTSPGDGIRHKGRGLIQITGKGNYKAVGDALGVDFIKNPTLLGGKNINVCTEDQLKYAAFSAGWFWNIKNLNTLADLIDLSKPIDEGSNLITFKKITKKINGGYNGLADRLRRFYEGRKFKI